MRDIAVTVAVLGALPFILKRPWFGIIVWTWLGFMNPHRMAWGFSTNMPFAYMVALVTLVAMLFSNEQKRIPWERESIVLFAFVGWMFITTIFAVFPELAWEQFEKVAKIQIMIFVAMILITTPDRLKYLVWIIVSSIAFYGIKGGIFTIAHGGVYRVEGPAGTFISGNNELGLAMAMTVPLLYFSSRTIRNAWGKAAIHGATVLTALAAIGTQSRGAMLGMAAMALMFWLKARNKFLIAILGGLTLLLIVLIMPETWTARMNTIETYDQDQSAMGRINAWWMAFNLAKDRFTGGGFETFQAAMFNLYAPNPNDARDVHSIYFEVLGEHGFVGLGLFLLLLFFTWNSARSLRRIPPPSVDFYFINDLLLMTQVSLVAYLVAGAFLGMAYFDYPYNLVLIVISIKAMYRSMGCYPYNSASSAFLKTESAIPFKSSRRATDFRRPM